MFKDEKDENILIMRIWFESYESQSMNHTESMYITDSIPQQPKSVSQW